MTTRADEKLPLWYEIHGEIVCQFCKAELLADWSPESVVMRRAYLADGDMAGADDEMVRPGDFQALGRRPWAGNDVGDRYYQCDHCQGQWGPDA